MPVYQDFGPGIGAGIDAFTSNLVNAMMAKRQYGLQKQAADDAHLAHEASMIATYGYSPKGTGAPSVAPIAPSAAPAPMAPDQAGLRDALANMGGGSNDIRSMPVADPIASMPTSRRAVLSPAQIATSRATDPSSMFEQNLTASFAGQSAQPTSRAAAGAANIPNRPSGAASASPTDFLSSLENAPPVTLSNGATIRPYTNLVRQLRVKQAEAAIDSDAKVDVSDRTGATARNQAESGLALRNATTLRPQDPGYAEAMGNVKLAESMGALPAELQKMVAQGQISLANALREIAGRGKVEAGLQANQQNFTAGQNSQERALRSDIANREIQAGNAREAGSVLNQSALENQRQRDHWWKPGPVVTSPPSLRVAPTAVFAPTQEQSLWDAAVQKYGEARVLKEYGPRPQ